jgi:hypothetical protein
MTGLPDGWTCEGDEEALTTKLEDIAKEVEAQKKELLRMKIDYYSRVIELSPVAATRERCERELEKLATEVVDYTEDISS